MTIHSEWARVFYNECPDAFVAELKKSTLRDMNVGVIDGHLQLMCLNEKMITWQRFLQYMFLNPIEQMFNMGCKTVVLCFDAYDFVPLYKNMTQLKRTQGKTVCTFEPHHDLPPKIPDDPMRFLMNRSFKLKLIQMICDRIPQLVKIKEHQEFIIDYKKVTLYQQSSQASSVLIPVHLPEYESMGESDVKFTRYVEKYGNALVHAIDGDYMIIALLYYAKRGILKNNKIFIYRQIQKDCSPCITSAAEAAGNSKKRSIDHVVDDFSSFEKPRHLHKKNKCWIDMQLIYVTMLEAFRQALRTDSAAMDIDQQHCDKEEDYIQCVVFTILCAGTDFSRQLPLIGPQRLWEHLPLYAEYLMEGLKQKQDAMILATFSKIYKTIFSKHVRCSTSAWSLVRDNLMSSSLAQSTKNKFPTEQQLVVTMRNILWVMSYWSTVNNSVETPVDGSNGYVLCPHTRKVQFMDSSPLATSPLPY